MEPLFTNTCLLTKEVYKEAYLAITRSRRILVVILSAVIFVSSLFEAYWTDDVLFYFFAGFFVLFPRRAANITSKRSQEIYHEEICSTIRFYDDSMITKSTPSNAEATLRYDQIVQVRASRQLYIITIKQKLLVILDKSKFDQINMIEFEHFLRQKAPKAKFRV